MITLVFLVCSPFNGECYSATSTVVYPTEAACTQDAADILNRNYKLQEEGKVPPEKAIYRCIEWGDPA